ncbi:MAG TPA: hypothetical protein VF752_13465 [Thermoleophilaceae bacterium]
MAHRKNIIARAIAHQRSDSGRPTEPGDALSEEGTTLDALLARLDRLEAQLEGLQDAVYREALRQNGRITAISKSRHNAAGHQ